jgi:two-component system response regulator NreC
LLESEQDFRIVGETGDGLDVVALVQRVRPRVLVMAVAMPGLNGLEVARQVRERFPNTSVVMLSMYSREQYVAQALRNGASGYVLKGASPSELVRAIRHAVAGHRYLSEPLSERSIRAWLVRAKTEAFDSYETLTDREREILQLVAEGYTSTAIAARFRISVRTVEAHRANVMRKMHFRNLVDVILFAINRGILVRARTGPADL